LIQPTTYAALAEQQRRQILDLLRVRERSLGDLIARLTLSQPGGSKHLKVLREVGLVDVHPGGRQRWHGPRAQPLAEVDAWLEPYRSHWSDRLDALLRHLEENPR
jgi:DNA-binding transcriptional ArsR family regulator